MGIDRLRVGFDGGQGPIVRVALGNKDGFKVSDGKYRFGIWFRSLRQ